MYNPGISRQELFRAKVRERERQRKKKRRQKEKKRAAAEAANAGDIEGDVEIPSAPAAQASETL